jgi:hypothetical protein
VCGGGVFRARLVSVLSMRDWMFKFRSRGLTALPPSTTSTLPTSSTLPSSVLCFPSSDQPPSSSSAFSRPNPAHAAVNKIHDEVLKLDIFVMTGAELESWRGYVHIAVETALKAQGTMALPVMFPTKLEAGSVDNKHRQAIWKIPLYRQRSLYPLDTSNVASQPVQSFVQPLFRYSLTRSPQSSARALRHSGLVTEHTSGRIFLTRCATL